MNMPPQNLTSLFSKSDYSWEYKSTARKMYTPYLPRLIPVPSDVLERQGKISVYKCTHHPSISFPRGKGRVTAPESPGSYQEAQMEEEQNLEQMLSRRRPGLTPCRLEFTLHSEHWLLQVRGGLASRRLLSVLITNSAGLPIHLLGPMCLLNAYVGL